MGILFSGMIQFAISSMLLVGLYTRFASGVADGVAETTIDAAVPDIEKGGRVHAGFAMAFGALTPFGFLAVSSTGRVLLYFVLSSVVRLVAYACDHPCGDPALTFVDEILHDVKDGLMKRVRRAAAFVSNWRTRRAAADAAADSEDPA
jgi:hypothetical protein